MMASSLWPTFSSTFPLAHSSPWWLKTKAFCFSGIEFFASAPLQSLALYCNWFVWNLPCCFKQVSSAIFLLQYQDILLHLWRYGAGLSADYGGGLFMRKIYINVDCPDRFLFFIPSYYLSYYLITFLWCDLASGDSEINCNVSGT